MSTPAPLFHNDISHLTHPLDPHAIDHLVFPSEVFETYLRQWSALSTGTRHLIISGHPDTGKTRAAYVLAEKRTRSFADWSPVKYVACNKKTFKQFLPFLAVDGGTLAHSQYRQFESVVILDNADVLTELQQVLLMHAIKRDGTTLILVTNRLSRIHRDIKRLCTVVPWTIPPFERCLPRLAHLASQVGLVHLTPTQLQALVYTPDGWSQMLSNLEMLRMHIRNATQPT